MIKRQMAGKYVAMKDVKNPLMVLYLQACILSMSKILQDPERSMNDLFSYFAH